MLAPTIIDVSNNYRVLALANPSFFSRRRSQGALSRDRHTCRVGHPWTNVLEVIRTRTWTRAWQSRTVIGKLLKRERWTVRVKSVIW